MATAEDARQDIREAVSPSEAVLTHGFAKHVARVPADEIRHAQHCRTDFLTRYDGPTLMEELDEDL